MQIATLFMNVMSHLSTPNSIAMNVDGAEACICCNIITLLIINIIAFGCRLK